jgi:hypothetical protein
MRLVATACLTCGAAIRRKGPGGFCKPCMALAEAAFRRGYYARSAAERTPDAWIRARNRFFGDRDVLLAAVRGELAATAAAV